MRGPRGIPLIPSTPLLQRGPGPRGTEPACIGRLARSPGYLELSDPGCPAAKRTSFRDCVRSQAADSGNTTLTWRRVGFETRPFGVQII